MPLLHYSNSPFRPLSVRTAFRILDNDQTGSVSADELRRVLENYCYKMNDEEFMKLMNAIDSDRDGRISYEEFMIKIGSEISFSGPLRRQSVMAEQARAPNPLVPQAPPPNRNRAVNQNYKASQISFG